MKKIFLTLFVLFFSYTQFIHNAVIADYVEVEIINSSIPDCHGDSHNKKETHACCFIAGENLGAKIIETPKNIGEKYVKPENKNPFFIFNSNISSHFFSIHHKVYTGPPNTKVSSSYISLVGIIKQLK